MTLQLRWAGHKNQNGGRREERGEAKIKTKRGQSNRRKNILLDAGLDGGLVSGLDGGLDSGPVGGLDRWT